MSTEFQEFKDFIKNKKNTEKNKIIIDVIKRYSFLYLENKFDLEEKIYTTFDFKRV